MDKRMEEPCIDIETGEILYPPLYNAETGEYEGTPNHPQRIRFRIPSAVEQGHCKKQCRPYKVHKRELELITAAIFLLPTMILFHPIVSLFTIVLEIILHNWAHRKNKSITKEGNFYYKSPLHGIVKEFCGRCKDQSALEKITKIQDMRNNDKMKNYSLDYIRRVV